MTANTNDHMPPRPLEEPCRQLEASPRDSARNTPDPLDAFGALVKDINNILGPCNGINSEGVNVEDLKSAMASYTSDEEEWKRYAFADYSRAYTRNLVDYGNGKANLLVLVWTPGQSSPIHDHANAHCVMKILKGSLTETVYAWPCQSKDPTACVSDPASIYVSTQHSCSAAGTRHEPSALQVRRSTAYHENEVTYMSDQLGLHRIGNPSDSEVAVSLHLYTPPNAAKHGCHVFNEATGKSSHVKQCHFYSELGMKME